MPDGKLALKNFGRAVNCSIAIIYPERLLFDYVHVGVSRGFDKNMFNSLAVPVKVILCSFVTLFIPLHWLVPVY